MRALALLVTVAISSVSSVACATATTTLEAVERLALQAAADGLYAGMLHVQRGDEAPLLSRGYGHAVPELSVPMQHDHRFPIGSNTKLFTAVAVWQLHAQRKLSVFDPASQHMNSSALGLNATWCPRAFNASASGPCQTPQLQHLMRMAGGLLEFLNCDYASDAWQQAYCATGARAGAAFTSFAMQQAAQFGAVGLTQFLAASGVLSAPLDFVPGASYHYSNAGYILLGHVVEHVSGLPLADYFRRHIFGPAGLTRTLYDPSAGALGLHAGMLPFPAYVAYTHPFAAQFEAVSGGTSLDEMQAALGSLGGRGFGDVSGGALRGGSSSGGSGGGAANDKSAAVLPGGQYAFTAKVPGPSGFDWTAANAAGAVVSTPQDMARWLRLLLSRPQALGLSASLLREMLGLSTQVPHMPVLGSTTWRFAQGLVVVPAPDHPRGLGVSHVYYLGSLGGFKAVLYAGLSDSADDARDIIVVSVAATVMPPTDAWSPGIERAADGRCSYRPPAAGNGSSTSGDNSTGAGVAGPSSSASVSAATDADGSTDSDAMRQFASAAPSASVPGVLCDVLDVVPVKAFGDVPNLLASRAVEAVTGAPWFGLQGGA